MSDWLKKVTDPSRDPYERRYRVFSMLGISLMAGWLVFASIIDYSHVRTGFFLFMVFLLTFKMIAALNNGTHQSGAASCSVLLVIFVLPFVFFHDNGIGAGVFNFAPMILIFILMTLQGKTRTLLVSLEFLVMAACYIVSYLRPELVRPAGRGISYLMSFCCLFFTCLMIFLALLFQMYMFRQERRLLEQRQNEIDDMNRSRLREQYEKERDEGSFVSGGKRHVMVVSDSAADLPAEWQERYGIRVIRHILHTEKGSFFDGEEINGDELMFYMRKDKKAHSEVPDETRLEQFFTSCLQDADRVIMITVADDSSPVYGHAVAASRRFERVSVFDSGSMSGGAGLMVLYAAYLANDGMDAKEILERLTSVKPHIVARFALNNTRYLRNGGRISPLLSGVFDAFMLHVLINMTDDKMKFSMAFGNHYRRGFIRSVFRGKRHIDTSLVFITYANVSENGLMRIRNEMERYVRFDRVVMMPTSGAVAVNVGPGTFGFMFHTLTEGHRNEGRLFDFLPLVAAEKTHERSNTV